MSRLHPTAVEKFKFWLLVELSGIGYSEQPSLYKSVFGERRHSNIKGSYGRDRRKQSIH